MSTNKVTAPGEKAQWRAVLAYSVGGDHSACSLKPVYIIDFSYR
jgi:hypothetical protein